MKIRTLITTAPSCLTAIGLLTLAAAMPARAAAPPALQGQVIARPLTSGDKTVYALPGSLELSGGLSTVGVGTAVYLEAQINIAIPMTDVTNLSWAVIAQPVGSAAALQSSPLGSKVPVYEPGDRSVLQVAGRTLFRPDVTGQYSVTATIATANSGTTNITYKITAGTYVGVNTCALCHSGGLVAPDMVPSWQNTLHSHVFADGVNGVLGTHINQSCSQCHATGYDTDTNAVNGGFDDLAKQQGWSFPTVLTNGNYDAMPAEVKALANVQCESCHGPGSEHAYALGNTNVSNWPRLSVTLSSGDCNQCHDAPTHHIKGTEWLVSGHANTTHVPTGPTRTACVACHTSLGFLARIQGWSSTNTTYAAIGCQTCHEPHGQTMPTNNPHMLRVLGSVTMPDGTTVTNAGEGSLCLECHHTRNGAAATNVANYQQGKPTWFGGSSFGVHDSPQGDMIEGVNAITYGQSIPSSAHRYTVTNLCVGCHMQATASDPNDPSFLKAGGHTFHMSYTTVSTNGVTNVVDKVDACFQCHGPIDSFDMPKQDYNGDGVIEGVQTEVQHLLDTLSTMLPNGNYVSNGNYVADGLVKSPSTRTNWPTKFLNAAYNWQFVNNDGSKGVHNAPFATGLLRASIADLTGISAPGGLPDWWVTKYFGSLTNPSGAANANPTGDGLPNWLKYALGLDPTVPGTSMPGGVVWANGKDLVNPVVNPGDTNNIAIFTAAEVAFNTEAGKTYQIQAISSLSETWSNIGAPIQGTGTPISYVTPTRGNSQQFFRVVHTP